MNIFANSERKVESFSFNIKEMKNIDYISESASSNTALRRIQKAEEIEKINDSIRRKEKEEASSALFEGVVNRVTRERQIENVIATIPNKVKTNLFKNIMCEMFVKSLYLDEDFVSEQKTTLENLITTYIDDNGGFKLLESTCIATNSELLKRMKKVCEESAKQVTKRIVKDCKDCTDPSHLSFDMTDDEKESFDYNKGSLDIERISSLVKQKILTVIKDEKQREEKQSELIADIEEDLTENLNVVDEATLNAELEKIIIGKSPIEESTLFGSLLRDSYAEYIAENVAITATDKAIRDEFRKKSVNYDTETEVEDLYNDEEDPVEQKDVNMDLVLTEAITKYTMMEMLYTLKFEDYSVENIRKLTEKLCNRPLTESAKKESKDGGNNPYFELRKGFFKIFNDLRDDVDTEKNKEKMQKFFADCEGDDEKQKALDSLVKQASGQIDNTIEKNPKMKDRLTELKDWLENGCESEEETDK